MEFQKSLVRIPKIKFGWSKEQYSNGPLFYVGVNELNILFGVCRPQKMQSVINDNQTLALHPNLSECEDILHIAISYANQEERCLGHAGTRVDKDNYTDRTQLDNSAVLY